MSLRQLGSLASCIEHGGFHHQLVVELGSQNGPALFGVRSIETNDDWRVDRDPLHCLENAVGNFFTSRDATKDVDEDRLDVRVVVDDLERT